MINPENTSSQWIRRTWIATAMAVLGGLAMALMHGRGWDTGNWWYLPFSVLLFALVMLPLLYFTKYLDRKEARRAQELVEGPHWAHWQCNADEARRFAESDWAQAKRKSLSTLFSILGIFLVVGLFAALTDRDVSLRQGLLLGAAIGGILGPLVALMLYSTAKSTYRKRMQAPGEVYIGPRGVYQDGSYSTWAGSGLSLNEVKLEPGDSAVLQFEIKDQRGGSTSTNQVRVAVPRGCEKEAAELLLRFTLMKSMGPGA